MLYKVLSNTSSTVQGPSENKEEWKNPKSIDERQIIREGEKTEWKKMAPAEMAGCGWQGQMDKCEVGRGQIYGHADPK